MEGLYTPANGEFRHKLSELKENDNETYEDWEKKRKSLKEDHPENLIILKEVLMGAISKRGWKPKSIPLSNGKVDVIIETLKGTSPISYKSADNDNEVIGLLDVYIIAVKDLFGVRL